MGGEMDWRSGDILQVTWDERPIRVLMGDETEVFYDAFFPEVGWNLARARTASYYRVSTTFLRSTARRIRTEPLTDAELARHRPDLPLRMLRNAEADWRKPLRDWPHMDKEFEVEGDRLALIPFGPKGAAQKAVIIEATNGRSFRGEDVLVAAHRIQTAECPDVHGVGLYRAGVSGGTPSYYLWGSVDQAGHAH